MNTRYRPQGIAGVLFGILGLVLATVIVLRRDWLSADAPGPALLRYAVLAAFFDLPVTFIILGIGTWVGLIAPYRAPESSEKNRAKVNVLIMLLTLPAWIALSAAIYTYSHSTFWISAWTLFMGYLLFRLAGGIKTLIPRE